MVMIVIEKKILGGKTKEQLVADLAKERIQARPFFYPLSSIPAIKRAAHTPISFDISKRAINLPCGQNITEEEVAYVCNCLLRILNK